MPESFRPCYRQRTRRHFFFASFFPVRDQMGMPRAYLYLDETGHEVFRITDIADRLESPTIGEIVELRDNRYRVEAVRMVPSRSLATEYRISVLLIAETLRIPVKGATV